MKRLVLVTIVAVCVCITAPYGQQQPQGFIGRISDSHCGASHQPTAGNLTERQCVFQCLKALAKFVLVDADSNVREIANQDLAGLPLYAGRPVRILGELKGNAILASRIEAYPPHLHLGHVMTNWRDTPGGVGLLIAAISEARIALAHASLAAKASDLAEMKLHAGHVLYALDPAADPDGAKGPSAGYGVKKAAAGAQQHLEFSVKAEGASAGLATNSTGVGAALAEALRLTDESIGVARKIRASATAAEAAPLLAQLEKLTGQIVSGSLAQAHERMTAILKAEGLENAPR